MRPHVVRATLRAAGLTTRGSSRACHSFSTQNHPIVKHSTVVSTHQAVSSVHHFSSSLSSASKGPEPIHTSSVTPKTEQVGNDVISSGASDSSSIISSEDLSRENSNADPEEKSGSNSVLVATDGDQLSVEDSLLSSATEATSKDSKSLLAELRTLLRRNSVRSALFHFTSAMRVPTAPSIDAPVLKLILPVLGRHGWAPAALEAINIALDRELNLEVGHYNCALHAMSRSGAFDTMHSVIQRMWSLPLESRPNATSYNYLIGSYMYRGAVDQAFDVLNEMKTHMIYPTFATYHALITGCLRSNDPRRAYSTLIAVERQRFDVGAMTIAQVLVSCAENDLVEETVNLFSHLKNALPSYSQEVHRIAERRNAYRINFKERTTAEDRAFVRGTTRLEIGALSALLHCAFRNCRSDLAASSWSYLRENYPNFQVPPPFWYCLIGALAGSGNFEKAFDALGMMRESGFSPRLKDLESALIKPLSLDVNVIDEQYFKLCDRVNMKDSTHIESDTSPTSEVPSKQSDLSTAGVVAEDMAENGSDGAVEASSEVLLNDVLGGSDSKFGASSDLDNFVSSSVGIDEVNCIIAACSAAGDLHRAFQTYDEVEKTFGLERNVDTFNALLEGCIQVKHARGGLRIMSEMEKLGHKLTGETVLFAVRLLTRSSRSGDCIDLLKRVRSEGGEVPLQAFLLLIRYYLRGDSVPMAVEVYHLGREAGYTERLLKGRLDLESVNKLNDALGTSSVDGSEPNAKDGKMQKENGNSNNFDESEDSKGEGGEQ